jgi:hypothetical protein
MRDIAARASSARVDLGQTEPNRLGRVGAGDLTLSIFVIGLAALFIWILNVSPPGASVERAPGISAGADPIEGPRRHVNSLGGYSFDPPAGWAIRDHGSASELISPDAVVVVSFGAGRPGALPGAASALLRSIRGEYRDVRLDALDRTEVDHRPAVVASGDLRNDTGVRVRFLGIARRMAGENHVIAVFVSQPAPADVLRVVERVIGSLEAA